MRLSLSLATGLLAAGAFVARSAIVSGEDLRLVRGTIAIGAQGPVPFVGEDWTLEVLGVGHYRIWFDMAYPAGVQNRPSVVAQSSTAIAYTTGVSNDYFDVQIATTSNLATSTPLHFVAVGPR